VWSGSPPQTACAQSTLTAANEWLAGREDQALAIEALRLTNDQVLTDLESAERREEEKVLQMAHDQLHAEKKNIEDTLKASIEKEQADLKAQTSLKAQAKIKKAKQTKAKDFARELAQEKRVAKEQARHERSEAAQEKRVAQEQAGHERNEAAVQAKLAAEAKATEDAVRAVEAKATEDAERIQDAAIREAVVNAADTGDLNQMPAKKEEITPQTGDAAVSCGAVPKQLLVLDPETEAQRRKWYVRLV